MLYKDHSVTTITGELKDNKVVTYKDVLTKKDKNKLLFFGLAMSISTWVLIGWLFWPSRALWHSTLLHVIISMMIILLIISVESIRFLQSMTLWFFARNAKDPIPMEIGKHIKRVAVLTTIVPNKEPIEMVKKTLLAMKELNHPESMVVDVWLLDESNSMHVKDVCQEIGVNHFSRKNIPFFNQKDGMFKAKTKHGNHNSWRTLHEKKYNVVAQMDPDHLPHKDFLVRSVGYFTDADVAFVVAPQVYGNIKDNWIAHGSAFQSYIFHGIIQRGGNGFQAPLLIGTNHLYRPIAFKQIGGYQDCIIEDHLTAMTLYGYKNESTGNHWKGVYTPDILAVGEGPTSFTDYFNQQKRWAYGIFEIAIQNRKKLIPKLKNSQKLSFSLLQSFYPSVVLAWILSNVATLAYFFGGITKDNKPIWQWAILWSVSMSSTLGFFVWLRKFNLVKHERRDFGLVGMFLFLMCIPIYVNAGLSAIFKRPLTYAVTAKGNLASPDRLRTFKTHLMWVLMIGLMYYANSLGYGFGGVVVRNWMLVTLFICMSPITIHYLQVLTNRYRSLNKKEDLLMEKLGKNEDSLVIVSESAM